MNNQLHLIFKDQGVRRNFNINLEKDTTLTTSTQMKKAILRSLLKGSTLMKRGKKKDFFLTRNGRIKLIILRGGNQKRCRNLEQSTTYQA